MLSKSLDVRSESILLTTKRTVTGSVNSDFLDFSGFRLSGVVLICSRTLLVDARCWQGFNTNTTAGGGLDIRAGRSGCGGS